MEDCYIYQSLGFSINHLPKGSVSFEELLISARLVKFSLCKNVNGMAVFDCLNAMSDCYDGLFSHCLIQSLLYFKLIFSIKGWRGLVEQ